MAGMAVAMPHVPQHELAHCNVFYHCSPGQSIERCNKVRVFLSMEWIIINLSSFQFLAGNIQFAML